MKAIIDGIRYETERAELVATYSNGHYANDFRLVEEELYRTDKGRWFLYGKGGALTDYRETLGNGWTSSEKIRPLTAPEAMAWLEEHGEVGAIEQYFPDEVEDA